MSPRLFPLVVTVAIALPVVALALPYLRRPTPRPARPPPALPAGVVRKFTPEGLEILVARPPSDLSATQSAPILLLHGAFGTATEWNRWLPYLASKGRTVYAVSLSGMSVSLNFGANINVFGTLITFAGHGESPRPPNFVFMGLRDLSFDLQAALNDIFLDDVLAPEPVLVAHSAGGGLAQYALANSNPDDGPLVSGLILLGSIPPSGMHRVLVRWWIHLDPWCIPRALWDMGDLRSPLSTPLLVQRAFFTADTPQGDVQEFFDFDINHEEAVSWMRDMMFRYVEPRNVKAKVPGERVFCVGGARDALVTQDIVRDTADDYGVGVEYVPRAGEFPFVFLILTDFASPGHHIQNDVSWREAADVVLHKVEEWGL